ncbi:MAG: endonuclease III [bacterium]|nr:endonuclease III [bacterium]
MVSAKKKCEAAAILDRLCERFPDAKIELDYDVKDPWSLLVAVCLSAQTTDIAVNKVTPQLLSRFKTVQDFAKVSAEEVEPYIRTLGLFRNKAKNLVKAAQFLLQNFKGKLPRERKHLEEIPGVGAKSAAVIIANIFNVQAIAVDTHVKRVSTRMGLTKNIDPSKIEKDLTALLPKEKLLLAHHTFIWQGRRICHARNPLCLECPVVDLCPRVGL